MSTPTQQTRAGRDSGLLLTPKRILALLIVAAAAWFIIGNNSKISIHLWLTWVSARLWLVLLVTFLAGALVGFLFGWRRR